MPTIDRAFSVMATTDPSSLESIEADVTFHQAILTGTGNELIAAFAAAIGTWLRLAFGVQRAARPDKEDFVPQHGAILQAIKRGDPDGARSAFRALLTRAESDAVNGMLLRGREQ